MASIAACAGPMTGSVCWSSSASMQGAKSTFRPLKTVFGKARKVGGRCVSASRAGASTRPSWLRAMAPWDFGRRWKTSSQARDNSAAALPAELLCNAPVGQEMHETGNILNDLPKRTRPKARKMLHDMWQAETRQDAHAAFDLFIETFEAKYSRATVCLIKDREELLTFYGLRPFLPRSVHWTARHLRWTGANSRPSTGRASGHQTQSRVPSPRSAIGPSAQRDASAATECCT